MTLFPTDKSDDIRPEDILRYFTILSIILLMVYIYQEIRRWIRGTKDDRKN